MDGLHKIQITSGGMCSGADDVGCNYIYNVSGLRKQKLPEDAGKHARCRATRVVNQNWRASTGIST